MGELFAELGDLVFTIVVSYISAIEFLYVVRHLYHYSFNHDATSDVDDSENLSQLQDSMRQQLANAKSKEAEAGTQVMKDGVPYKDGFRLEAQQALIDQLKEQLTDKELSDMRRQELEKELAEQKKIAEELRKELAEAEAKYQRQLKQEEEEAKAKKLLAEQELQEREERAKKEIEEQARKIAEAEKRREEEERKREEKERIKKEKEEKEKERKQREDHERKEAEEQALRLAQKEKQRETEQRYREEAEENARKLREAEKQKEIEQRKLEEEQEQAEKEKLIEIENQRKRQEAEEHTRRMEKAEKQKVIEQHKLVEEEELLHKERELAEAKENELRLLGLERAYEENQAAEDTELAIRNRLEIEHRLEEQLREAEKEAELTEKERQLIDSIKKRDLKEEEGNEYREAELLQKILQAREQLGEESEEEQTLRLIQRERDQEAKQKRIEENALLFMEAEKEMAELQSKMLDAVEKREFSGNLDSAPQSPIVEAPCIKKTFSPLSGGESSHSTVKTQLAQDLDKPYSVRTKPLLFPGISDDASSIDPASSKQSSFSTQPSEELTTGTDSQYLPTERQEPDGEDTTFTNMQYSDDYLRSLDGIKQRPLVREDGSGRRRAFKKRRSSNSSNSSRESRHSRDEELKMFTSLEEEEMKDTADSEFTPIRYTTDPTLKVKGHRRRHKRSPAKDMRRGDDSLRSSLECLGEETSDPWGEVKPEHYKHTEFWKREKTLSIDEEAELEKPVSSEELAFDTATNMPSASSFEEATQKQNQEAFTAIQKQSAQKNIQDPNSEHEAAAMEGPTRSDNTNLLTSQKSEKEASAAPSFAPSPLQRSPHTEETDHNEENDEALAQSTFSTAQNTPTINVQAPSDFGSWRDEYGLIMEGLSDFYDFTASVNPSRSRPTSRNVSPANTTPNTPLPKDVSNQSNITNEGITNEATVEIYDDTGAVGSNEFKKENILNFIDSFNAKGTKGCIKSHMEYVADDHSEATSSQKKLVPLVNIVDTPENSATNFDDNASGDAAMNLLVSSLRLQRSNRSRSRSRSRSKSPLPTPDNLKRSVENRRYKMIKHNEDILEKLIETKLLPELPPPEETEDKSSSEIGKSSVLEAKPDKENSSQDQLNYLVESLHMERQRSRSKSPMRLPTPENLNKGLEKRRSKLIERNDELIKQLEERSQTPESPTIVIEEHMYEMESSKQPTEDEEDCSRETMNLLVQSLRIARSKTRSTTPKDIEKQTECVETSAQLENLNIPTISIAFSEAETAASLSPNSEHEEEYSREKMDLLVQFLRDARSRSISKSPMRLPDDKLMQNMEGRAKTPERSALTAEYVYQFEKAEESQRSRYSRSMSPSRSHSISPGAAATDRPNTPSRSLSPHPDDYNDFHVMLNLEGSKNRTLSISTEEQESLQLANRQRQLDEEALQKLRNASEETELRTLSPITLDRNELQEQQRQDHLADLPVTERAKFLKKSPTTPDYDRTISEEMRDVARIKQEMLEKGFKRSTYVGESLDLGSEFESLRRETAKFQRSRSPSPSVSTIESVTAQINAEEKRKIQNLILEELTTSSSVSNTDSKESKNTGAIPKTERSYSYKTEMSIKDEIEDIKQINETILSSDVRSEHPEDKSETLAKMRRRNAEFRRSASTSRSPLRESQLEELASIEVEATKRLLKDKFLDEISSSSASFKDLSRHLNTDSTTTSRRASDSTLLKVPEILVQFKDDGDLEPEEYHHYRRFSLAQEEPVEQYPGDDYIFIQQVEVRTRSGSRTWLREDFYSENVEEYLAKRAQSRGNSVEKGTSETVQPDEDHSSNTRREEHIPGAGDDEEEYSNASEDDRQTVVEVDDEIDEDISDFNERGPAEESHHETSECEEAEREMDRYAGREASDWNRIIDTDNDVLNVCGEEGAVGGLNNSPYDSDSFAIDQIYDEAIKNRKQSGILREYDSILRQMSTGSDIDEQYLLWSKTGGKANPKNVEFNTQFLDNERKDSDMRYLGDANVTARQSARLRSRYGYSPVLKVNCLDDDFPVDLNYKPKREYNWRKNFKLDEDVVKEDKEITLDEICANQGEDVINERTQLWEGRNYKQEEEQTTDASNFSLEAESVTLFSRSPERSTTSVDNHYRSKEELSNQDFPRDEAKEEKQENTEKPKKKKTKKKSHKESKASLEETMNREDEDAYDNQVYSRRSSSIQMDTDSPKRKSRSRRSSKSSLANEDTIGSFSTRSNVAFNDSTAASIAKEFRETVNESGRPKKMKKRKKVKETMANVAEVPMENKEELPYEKEPLDDIPAVSAAITPESSNFNILSSLSPQNSRCVTPASIDTDVNLSIEDLRETTATSNTNSSSTSASSPSGNLSRGSSITTTSVDTFDILKDANFYPLF